MTQDNLYPLFYLKFKYVLEKYGKDIDSEGLMDAAKFYEMFFADALGELVTDAETARKYYTNTVFQAAREGLVDIFFEGKCTLCNNLNLISEHEKEVGCILDKCTAIPYSNWSAKNYRILFCISQRAMRETSQNNMSEKQNAKD